MSERVVVGRLVPAQPDATSWAEAVRWRREMYPRRPENRPEAVAERLRLAAIVRDLPPQVGAEAMRAAVLEVLR